MRYYYTTKVSRSALLRYLQSKGYITVDDVLELKKYIDLNPDNAKVEVRDVGHGALITRLPYDRLVRVCVSVHHSVDCKNKIAE